MEGGIHAQCRGSAPRTFWLCPGTVYLSDKPQASRARICKRLWSPGIDSEETFPPAYVAWQAGRTNRVIVPARQAGNRFLGSLQGLQIRALVWRHAVVLDQRLGYSAHPSPFYSHLPPLVTTLLCALTRPYVLASLLLLAFILLLAALLLLVFLLLLALLLAFNVLLAFLLLLGFSAIAVGDPTLHNVPSAAGVPILIASLLLLAILYCYRCLCCFCVLTAAGIYTVVGDLGGSSCSWCPHYCLASLLLLTSLLWLAFHLLLSSHLLLASHLLLTYP